MSTGTGTSEPLRTRYRVTNGTLLIDLGTPKRILSSAPCRGGWRLARYILNHQVEANPVSSGNGAPRVRPRVTVHESPSRALVRVARQLGVQGPVVGLMTAVPMSQLVTSRRETRRWWVECFATVGVTNAVRAGEPSLLADPSPELGPGTINLIIVTNACLSPAAMVGALQVVTESKTGLLRDHAVPSWTGQPGATGTGTDAVVVACSRRGAGDRLIYSGTHTEIGAMIGQAVSDCMRQGLACARPWTRQAPSDPSE